MKNINSKQYWDQRFATGDWDNRGRVQTQEYAKANIEAIAVDASFVGTISDFGCALGDAIPMYAKAFPKAKLIGIDISKEAIKICKEKYGNIAAFLCCDYNDVPYSDVIIASHVMEHIDNDTNVVSRLLLKCKDLFVIVPYMEDPLYFEHVNFYDESYFNGLGVFNSKIFQVTYKQNKTFKEIIKGIFKFDFNLQNNIHKNIISFHFKQSSIVNNQGY